MHTGFQMGNLEEIDHFEDLDIGGRIILECLLNK
jgi:hypothetical protein